MKSFVVIGDLHLLLDDQRLKVFSDFWDYFLKEIHQDGEDIIFLGDIFDKSLMSGEVIDLFIEKLQQAKNSHKYILQGNHDYSKQFRSIIKPLRWIDNVTIIDDIKEIELLGNKCLFLPYRYTAKEDYKDVDGKYDYIFLHITDPKDQFSNEGIEIKAKGKKVYGHCFSEDTEILTKRGWIKGFDLKKDDIVATMNKNSELLEWNSINAFFEYSNYNELYYFNNQHINILATDEHGVIYKRKMNNRILETKMNSLKYNMKLFCALNNSLEMKYNLDYLRFIVWIVTDGAIENNKGSIHIRWHLKKERKIKRLVSLLERLCIKYSYKPQKSGNVKINLSVDVSKIWIELFKNGKKLPDWFMFLCKEEADAVLEEYANTDGCYVGKEKNGIQISSSKEEEIDILQILCVTNGYRTIKHPKKNTNNIFFLQINVKNRLTTYSSKSYYKKIKYKGKVWCINVDNGTLISRREGKVCITLNTHIGNTRCLGVPYATKFGEQYNEYQLVKIFEDKHLEYIKLPKFFDYVSIEHGDEVNPANMPPNFKLIIENAPNRKLAKEKYKGYKIYKVNILTEELKLETKDSSDQKKSLGDLFEEWAKKNTVEKPVYLYISKLLSKTGVKNEKESV
jgi:hypothetical protein